MQIKITSRLSAEVRCNWCRKREAWKGQRGMVKCIAFVPRLHFANEMLLVGYLLPNITPARRWILRSACKFLPRFFHTFLIITTSIKTLSFVRIFLFLCRFSRNFFLRELISKFSKFPFLWIYDPKKLEPRKTKLALTCQKGCKTKYTSSAKEWQIPIPCITY